ncbi:MAG: hypothetical protein M3Y34_05810 [Actinomycetota bacterium]|nr:hypothetical protein [Actinomycetota bacterium]
MSDARQSLADFAEVLGQHSSERECVELCPICRAADVFRDRAADDLREGWQDVQREALLTLKALIDRYVERLDEQPAEPGPKVEEIPID